jgi:hypothetical protein
MPITNTYVQETLSSAIAKLTVDIANSHDLNAEKLTIVKDILILFKSLSKSGNDIPSLAGLGLSECLDFSEKYLASEKNIAGDIINFTPIFTVINKILP